MLTATAPSCSLMRPYRICGAVFALGAQGEGLWEAGDRLLLLDAQLTEIYSARSERVEPIRVYFCRKNTLSVLFCVPRLISSPTVKSICDFTACVFLQLSPPLPQLDKMRY